MRIQIFAVLALVGAAIAQGVTGQISPKGDAPDGCKASSDGKFEIAIVELNNPTKRDLALQNRATCSGTGILVAQLASSVLTDDHARTGYIASNYQFQFDAPPQAGALYTAGFSHCANGSLALGSSTVFYQCRSGSFYNLYDRWWAEQCEPVEIIVMPCGDAEQAGGGGGGETVVGTQIVTTTVVAPLGDGQPQVVTTTTAVLICQIGDGQIQGHTTPCSGTGALTIQTSTPSVPPVSQYSDGQIQVTPAPSPSASNSNGGGGGGETVTVPSSSSASESASGGGNTPGSASTASGGAQVTSSSATIPVEVPTSAPGVNGASGGMGGRVGVVAMVGLGVAGMVWGW